MDGGQPASASRAEVLIRVRSDVTPTMRAVIRGVTYEVKSAVPRDRDALILDIEEVRL